MRIPDRFQELFRAAKFGIAGAVGFLVAEVILSIGVFALYGSLNVQTSEYASVPLLELNALAFGVGVTVSFFINERITVREKIGGLGTKRSTITRLLKFQLVYLLGNIITVGIQLLLLKQFSLAPSLGTIVGAIVAFPVSYVISMKFVWAGKKGEGKPTVIKEEEKEGEEKAKKV